MQTNERLGSKQVQNAATDESAQHVPTSINNLGNPLGQALPVGTQTLLTSNIPTTISPDFNYRAEYKLLTDILVSVPKIKNEKVCKFISSAECPQPIENIHNYIQTFEKHMPKLTGIKAHALPGLIRDMPESST
jgi:hypothetical protein